MSGIKKEAFSPLFGHIPYERRSVNIRFFVSSSSEQKQVAQALEANLAADGFVCAISTAGFGAPVGERDFSEQSSLL